MNGASRRVVVVLAILASCGSLATGVAGSAAPSDRGDGTATARSADGGAEVLRASSPRRDVSAGKAEIPELPYDPSGNLSAWGIQTRPTEAVASKAKIKVSMGTTNILGYLNFCVAVKEFGLDSCCPDPQAASCHKVPIPTYVSDKGPFWVEQFGRAWVASPSGSPSRFGVFEPVKVRALAFGSVPVTATVHVRQPVDRTGMVQPLSYYTLTGSPFAAGDSIDGFGIAPPYPDPENPQWVAYYPSNISGNVDIRLSDVAVDGRPLDVGDNCRTATSGRLQLTSAKGYAPNLPDPGPLRGRPGGFGTEANGTLQGNLTIPPFAGCGNGTEDLDPLITAFVSAKNNAVETRTNKRIDKCEFVDFCPPYPREAAPEQPQGLNARSTAAVPSASRSGLTRSLEKLPESKRRTLVRMLPPSLLAGVPARLRAR